MPIRIVLNILFKLFSNTKGLKYKKNAFLRALQSANGV